MELGLGQLLVRDQRAAIGRGRRRVARHAGERIDAQHRRAAARRAGQARWWRLGVDDLRRIGGLGEALPAEDAARLAGARAGGQGRAPADRRWSKPASRPDRRRRSAPQSGAPFDPLLQQAHQVKAALAVPGQNDRPVARRLAQEFLIGGEHIAIGEVESAARIFAGWSETSRTSPAGISAPTPRRPPLNALAWLRTNRLARHCDSPSVQRRVPGVAVEERGRVHEKHRGARGRRRRGDLIGMPQGRVAADVGPRDPHPGLAVGAARRHRDVAELGAGNERPFARAAPRMRGTRWRPRRRSS